MLGICDHERRRPYRNESDDVGRGATTIPLTANTYDSYGVMGGCPGRGGLLSRSGVRQQDSGYGTTFIPRGNVAMVQVPGRTVCMTHDVTGRTVNSSDVDGHSKANGFTGSNNYAAPVTITPNGLGSLTTNYSYSPFLGLTGITGPNTDTLSVAYDTQARPLSRTSPPGAQTTFTYLDSVRQRTATTNGRTTRTTFDGFGRITKQERLDTAGAVRSIVDTEYVPCACSPLGKVYRVSMPCEPGGTVYSTTYSYDPLGRTVSVTCRTARAQWAIRTKAARLRSRIPRRSGRSTRTTVSATCCR